MDRVARTCYQCSKCHFHTFDQKRIENHADKHYREVRPGQKLTIKRGSGCFTCGRFFSSTTHFQEHVCRERSAAVAVALPPNNEVAIVVPPPPADNHFVQDLNPADILNSPPNREANEAEPAQQAGVEYRRLIQRVVREAHSNEPEPEPEPPVVAAADSSFKSYRSVGQKKELLRRFADSSSSQKEFAAENGIPEGSLSAWWSQRETIFKDAELVKQLEEKRSRFRTIRRRVSVPARVVLALPAPPPRQQPAPTMTNEQLLEGMTEVINRSTEQILAKIREIIAERNEQRRRQRSN